MKGEIIMSNMLARKLRDARKAKKLSQGELAEKSGISLMSIRRYETIGEGNREPQANKLQAIANALEVPVNYFLIEDGEVDIPERDLEELRKEVADLRYSLNEKGLRKVADYMYDLIEIKKYKIGN